MITITPAMQYSQNKQVKMQSFGRRFPKKGLSQAVGSDSVETLNAKKAHVQQAVFNAVHDITNGECRASVKVISALNKLFDTLAESGDSNMQETAKAAKEKLGELHHYFSEPLTRGQLKHQKW